MFGNKNVFLFIQACLIRLCFTLIYKRTSLCCGVDGDILQKEAQKFEVAQNIVSPHVYAPNLQTDIIVSKTQFASWVYI